MKHVKNESLPAAPAEETGEGKNNVSIHAGHRRRLREAFMRELPDGPDALSQLELLLCYAIPRGDVNPLAHALLDRFGSLGGVLEASPDALLSVTGVGESTAILISLVNTLRRTAAIEETTPCRTFDTLVKLETFLRPLFTGLANERVYLVMLDNGLHLIDCVNIGDGVVNTTPVSIRRIAELCLHRGAACAVLAHNHPHGLAIPSSADLEMTGSLDSALDLLDIQLLEHLIITDHSCCPILRSRKGAVRASPVPGDVDGSFFETFYRGIQ